MTSLRAAVKAFQKQVDSYEEYGVTDEDAAKGLRAAFEATGTAFVDDCEFCRSSLKPTPDEQSESARRQAESQERIRKWNAEHPDRPWEVVLGNMLNQAFSTAPLFHVLRDQAKK